jgi:hypothetical protein
MEEYLQALVAKDPLCLHLSSKATENAKPTDFKSGLWQKATRIGNYKIIIKDPVPAIKGS